ncbi:hypothetical protein BGZ97_009192, partial [Linnemannia gamsii]
MSPIANHYLVSPHLGPLSPYPTPQHQPRQHHYSSPHPDPTMVSGSGMSKQSVIPAMILPASALSSGGLPLLPHEMSSSSSSTRTYANILPNSNGSNNTSNSNDVGMGSPTSGPVDPRSAPPSPRRYVMLPPQSPAMGPTSGNSGRPSRSQGR